MLRIRVDSQNIKAARHIKVYLNLSGDTFYQRGGGRTLAYTSGNNTNPDTSASKVPLETVMFYSILFYLFHKCEEVGGGMY